MKKNDKIHIPISTSQKDVIKARAESCGMTLSQYCLFILLKAEPVIENIPD